VVTTLRRAVRKSAGQSRTVLGHLIRITFSLYHFGSWRSGPVVVMASIAKTAFSAISELCAGRINQRSPDGSKKNAGPRHTVATDAGSRGAGSQSRIRAAKSN